MGNSRLDVDLLMNALGAGHIYEIASDIGAVGEFLLTSDPVLPANLD